MPVFSPSNLSVSLVTREEQNAASRVEI